MKVLLINGSPKANGCTFTALSEIASVLNERGIATEIIQTGNALQDCVDCGGCKGKGKCVFSNDCVNEIIEKAKTADGFVFGTPVYYAHPTGRILSVLDRVFYAGKQNFEHKPAAVIASARRAGTTVSVDTVTKYLGISQMPVVSSTYWNMVHGNTPEEVKRDLEGMETMRNIGVNMAWLLECIQAGKKAGINVPDTKKTVKTNFIR